MTSEDGQGAWSERDERELGGGGENLLPSSPAKHPSSSMPGNKNEKRIKKLLDLQLLSHWDRVGREISHPFRCGSC